MEDQLLPMQQTCPLHIAGEPKGVTNDILLGTNDATEAVRIMAELVAKLPQGLRLWISIGFTL